MDENPLNSNSNDDGTRITVTKIIVPLLLVVSVFIFYWFTLAPTLLWGDNAFFQRSPYEGILLPDAGGHWLWYQFARLFTLLASGLGDVAFRVNLLSAAAGTATILLLYLAILKLGLRWQSAILATLALAVSHTFWMYSVRAEVYTVFMAVMALQLWLWFSWREDRPWPIYAAGALAGLTVLGHQMALLLGPAALYLLWRQRRWLTGRQWTYFWLLLLAGLIFLLVVVRWQTRTLSPLDGLWAYFTHFNADVTGAMLDFSLALLPRDTMTWIGLTGLQFVGLAGVMAIYGVLGNTLRSVSWQCLLILYATCLFFAFSYRVNDQFVFYLPSYVALVFFIANGFEKLQRVKFFSTNIGFIVLLLVSTLLPIATYAAVPRLLSARGLNPLGARTLPGRDPNEYFLWPASNGYWGAYDFARDALEAVPPNTLLLADHTPYETLLYMQNVEGVRRDVQMMRVGQEVSLAAIAEETLSQRPLFLAHNDPRYFNIPSLAEYCIVPVGNIYQIVAPTLSECP